MPKKIMIVDDNLEFLKEIQELLQHCRYETVIVPYGDMAFDLACSTKPDMILLDLKMAQINGFQIALKLKHFEETMHMPIIAMSGILKSDFYQPLIEAYGMDGFIKKPFSPFDLMTLIEQVCDHQQKQHS